ncbi:hypothetical protein JN06_00647 [Bacteroides zoogleoformans]|nr:hypothetical protein JN06_00647 [Bacteroides zoogleoformans]
MLQNYALPIGLYIHYYFKKGKNSVKPIPEVSYSPLKTLFLQQNFHQYHGRYLHSCSFL